MIHWKWISPPLESSVLSPEFKNPFQNQFSQALPFLETVLSPPSILYENSTTFFSLPPPKKKGLGEWIAILSESLKALCYRRNCSVFFSVSTTEDSSYTREKKRKKIETPKYFHLHSTQQEFEKLSV